jgi:hypothetical protein
VVACALDIRRMAATMEGLNDRVLSFGGSRNYNLVATCVTIVLWTLLKF